MVHSPSQSLIGWAEKAWDGNFDYHQMATCSSVGYDPTRILKRRGSINPALEYVPYFNLYDNQDCSDYSKKVRHRPVPELVQCGLHHYGPNKQISLNWAYGPDHHSESAPGSAKGGNWAAMSEIGKSFYAPTGHMVGRFVMKEQGSLRDPHWHSNAAEFTYIVKGTARVTVTGLPATDMQYNGFHDKETNNEDTRATRTIQSFDRKSETFLVRPGDAFYSPVGYHHYFEGVGVDDPLIGIAVFDTNDLVTFDTPQVMKGLPNELLAQVLDIPQENAQDMYKGFRRAFVDPHEGWSDAGLYEALENDNNPDLLFKIPALPNNLTLAPRSNLNGQVMTKAIDASTWNPMYGSKFSFAYTEISPGALLEPYWVDNADEIIYVLEGENIEIIRNAKGKMECKDVFTVEEGYLALSEIGSTWTIKNKDTAKTAKLLRIFNSNQPSMTTLYDAFYSLPQDVVQTMTRKKYYNQYQ